MFPVVLQNLRPSGVLFSKETVCEKFQIAREKVVVTVTTTIKSGGDMSPPSQSKLRLWCIVCMVLVQQPSAAYSLFGSVSIYG